MPLAANMTNMVRSLVSFTHSSKKKNAKVVVASVNACPATSESTTSMSEAAPKDDRMHRRRRKNRALTEKEFSGCILCFLDKSRNDSIHDASSSGESRPFRAIQAPTLCLGCLRRQKKVNGSRHGRILPHTKPLLPYLKLSNPTRAKKVHFVSGTKSAGGGVAVVVADDEHDEQHDSENEEKEHHEQQRGSSWDDLLRSLKKDRRRTHNFALTEDEFDNMIFPSLEMTLQQAIPPSA